MMGKTAEVAEIALSEAGLRLRVPYHRVFNLVLEGRLDGRRLGGRWLVTVSSIERLIRERQAQTPAASGPSAPGGSHAH